MKNVGAVSEIRIIYITIGCLNKIITNPLRMNPTEFVDKPKE